MKQLEKKVNYMSIPAAIQQLEKIERVRQTYNIYRLDYAVFRRKKYGEVIFQITPLLSD